MRYLCITMALALMLMTAAPAMAICPVAATKEAQALFKEVEKMIEEYGQASDQGQRVLANPGDATTLSPGQPPSPVGPAPAEDKAALDSLGFDLDAAGKVAGSPLEIPQPASGVAGSPLEIPTPPSQ